MLVPRLALVLSIVACGTPPRAAEPPATPVPPSAPSATTDDLGWDRSIGWTPRIVFAPSVTEIQREGATITLAYALGPSFTDIARAGLRDRTLLVRSSSELCHPALASAVRELHPDRLLLDIESTLDESALACLATLAQASDVFVSTCTTSACSDGDAQLALLASSSVLRERLRGLAIGLHASASWTSLPTFPRLTHLVVQGEALGQVDALAALQLCQLSDLRFVGVLDAARPGLSPDVFPPACILHWSTFEAHHLSFMGLPVPEPDLAAPCLLSYVFVDTIDDAHRDRLLGSCPQLRELTSVHPMQRCARSEGALACRPL